MPNFVLLTFPSLQALGKTQTGVFPNSRFLDTSIIKENCNNARTIDDIDMRLRQVIKLYKKNKATSKNFDDDIMSEDCDVIVSFSIYVQFGAI